MAAFKNGELDATVEVVADGSERVRLREVRCCAFAVDDALTFQRVLGRRTARCSLARGVVDGDSRARWARVGRDEAVQKKVRALRKQQGGDALSATEEASEEKE